MSHEDIQSYKNELFQRLRQKEQEGKYDILIEYFPVSTAFPSCVPHAQLNTLSIDWQALDSWSCSIGWKAVAALENTPPEQQLTPYIRFTKI